MLKLTWSQRVKYTKYALCIVSFLVVLGVAWWLLRPAGTVDNNLQWEQRDANFWQFKGCTPKLWLEDGASYCQHLELDHHYDWRLPTLVELQSLRAMSASQRINMAKVDGAIYWSGTPYNAKKLRYWALSLFNGQSAAMATHNYNAVVCVRTINKSAKFDSRVD